LWRHCCRRCRRSLSHVCKASTDMATLGARCSGASSLTASSCKSKFRFVDQAITLRRGLRVLPGVSLGWEATRAWFEFNLHDLLFHGLAWIASNGSMLPEGNMLFKPVLACTARSSVVVSPAWQSRNVGWKAESDDRQDSWIQ